MAAKPETPSRPEAASAPTVEKTGGGFGAWLPAIVSVVLAPAATWGAIEFVMLPRLQEKVAAGPAAQAAVVEGGAPDAPRAKGKDGKEITTGSYEFQNVVVNLAGTMGTRYLKTSFLVTGVDPNVKTVFESAKPRLTDVTLNVLSSLTLADLEEPGAKNVIREKLVAAYNQALGRKVADQVYFSDFVVQ